MGNEFDGVKASPVLEEDRVGLAERELNQMAAGCTIVAVGTC
jgi:hypothetical protein